MNRVIIEAAKVSADGSRYEGEESPEILELAEDSLAQAEGPVAYDLFAQVVSHELVVQGKLEVPIRFECSRCACFFSTTVSDSSFLRAYPVPEGTEIVDLTPDIREDILLNLPPFPLCRPDCKGLCPQCGKNWNEGPCECKPSDGGQGRWSALDDLDLP